jgi:predicted glycosyltransferase involved in capsule biosynthesis
MWKQDIINTNGFDEIFEAWGYEDSDLVIRLIHNGVKRKEGRFALPVLHLWHKDYDLSNHDQNYRRLLDRVDQKSFIQAKKGLKQHL